MLDSSERYSGGMDKRKRLQIELSRQERKQVEELLSGGVQPVRAVIRALVLRQIDEGRTTVEAGAGVGISAKAGGEIVARYPDAEPFIWSWMI